MRQEPYDPDARDADNDGVVQEGTAWERPAGTRLVDEIGRAITRGANATSRPRGLRVVDGRGNPVDYTPTYEKPEGRLGTAGTTTPLSEIGALSLRERGLPSLRDINSRPATAPPQPSPPEPAGAPKVDKKKRIRQRNREVLDSIEQQGGSWARITSVFRRRSESKRSPVFPILTPQEAATERRRRQKEELKALQHFLRTGKAPTEKEGFPIWAERKYANEESWQQRVDRMDPELVAHLRDSDIDDLISEAEQSAKEFHEGLLPPSVRIPVDRVDAIISDPEGRYRTTHEVSSKHSDASMRDSYERMNGIPEGADVDVRPASGYVVHQDMVDAAREEFIKANGREPTEFDRLPIAEGPVDIYGDIELMLDPEVAGRTAVGRSDSLNNASRVVRMDSQDEDEVANAVLDAGGKFHNDLLDSTLNHIEAHRTGSHARVTDRRGYEDPEKTSITEPAYTEALIAGSFDLQDVALVRLGERAREVRPDQRIFDHPEPILGSKNGKALQEEIERDFYSTEALLRMGLTQEEIDYLQSEGLMKLGNASSLGYLGSTQLTALLEYRKAKDLEEKFKSAGVERVVHLHPSGKDLMDPNSYGTDASLGTVDEIRRVRLERTIVEEARKAIARRKDSEAKPAAGIEI